MVPTPNFKPVYMCHRRIIFIISLFSRITRYDRRYRAGMLGRDLGQHHLTPGRGRARICW